MLVWVPTGSFKMPAVPIKWADAYHERQMGEQELFNDGESPEVVRSQWLRTNDVAKLFGVKKGRIIRNNRALYDRKGKMRMYTYKHSITSYLHSIRRMKIGRITFWNPKDVEAAADAFKRKLPPPQRK